MTVDQIFGIREFLPPGITADALSKKTTLGGTGPNIAVAAAKLGCPTSLCAFVGPDFPASYMQFMRDSGLIMDDVMTLEGEETSSCVIINDSELVTRVFFYQGPQGHADSLGVDLTGTSSRASHVHFCTGQPSYYIRMMNLLKGRSMALDPAQEVHKVWNADLVREALPMADSLFCNELEAETLCGYLGLKDILDADVGLVVNTMGDKGSRARYRGEDLTIPVVPGGKPVDVTGAGDTYRAGFYTALYKGHDVPEALVIASAVSSFTVEKVGALTNIPSWDSVMERAEPVIARIC